MGKHVTHGPVLFYNQEREKWEAVCDKGFNDNSATLVCQELGFELGKSIGGSAYGKIYEDVYENKTFSCEADSKTITSCMRDGQCNNTDLYASVVCFKNRSQPLDNCKRLFLY